MIPTDWPPALGFAIETTLGVTFLVMLVLLLRKPVATRFGASAAYALWALPIIRLVLPPLPSGWTIWPQSLAASGETVQALPATAEETAAFVVGPSGSGTAEIVVSAQVPPVAPLPPEIVMASPVNWPLVLATVWAIGAVVALGVTMNRHRKFMQVVDAEALPASGKLEMMSADVAAEIGLRGEVRICNSLISSGPMVTGLLRPTVMLPVWFEDDYAPLEQRAAIAHELTHVKRKDLWMLQFAHAAMALQWFNPLAHFALRAFRSDQEAACDADVLRRTNMTPRDYGATLVKAVKLSRPTRGTLMAGGLPLTHAIKDRLVLLQSPQPTFRSKLIGGGMTALVGAFAIVATASAHPPEENGVTINGITITDGELTIDGETYEDRRFVLLDEPFEGKQFQFELDGDFEVLGEALAKEGEAIAEIFEDMDFSAMIELEGLADLKQLGELAALADLPEMIEELVGDVQIIELNDGSTQIVIPRKKIVLPNNTKNIEAYAEKMAARAQAWAKREPQLQVRLKAMEERADAMREKADAHAMAFSYKVESKIRPTTNAIDALAKSCANEALEIGNPVLLERKIDGRSLNLKAICLKDDPNGDHAALVQEFLSQIPSVTDAQKRRVINELSNSGQSSRYEVELSGGDAETED